MVHDALEGDRGAGDPADASDRLRYDVRQPAKDVSLPIGPLLAPPPFARDCPATRHGGLPRRSHSRTLTRAARDVRDGSGLTFQNNSLGVLLDHSPAGACSPPQPRKLRLVAGNRSHASAGSHMVGSQRLLTSGIPSRAHRLCPYCSVEARNDLLLTAKPGCPTLSHNDNDRCRGRLTGP